LGLPKTYNSSQLRELISQLERFKSLSDDDKSLLKETIVSLVEKGFPSRNIKNLLSTLRPEEGVVARKAILRFKTAITPVQLRREGVYRPLMSGYNSGGNKLTIFLPEHLESYADHGLILELLRYRSSVEDVDIQRAPGELKIQNEERLTQLIMGYISELLSDQKIAKVSYTRSSYYQLGRMLARAKLLQFIAMDCNIPIKFLQIPIRFLGGTTEFQDPESIRTLKSLISGDVELIDDLLKNLASHVYKTQGSQVKQKIDACLFTAFPEFVHMHERRARVQNKKGRTGRVITTYTTIKATKPSTLVTVAPWERDAVEELYDSPWADQTNLEREYNSTPALERDYNSLSHRLGKLVNEQWFNKQLVLRKTNHRLAVSGLDDKTPLWQRLNSVRSILTEQKSIETCDRETLKRIVSAYDILPSGVVTLEDGFSKPWTSAFKAGDLRIRYPQTSRLIDTYEDNIRPPNRPDRVG
jgi:hypothetical protein